MHVAYCGKVPPCGPAEGGNGSRGPTVRSAVRGSVRRRVVPAEQRGGGVSESERDVAAVCVGSNASVAGAVCVGRNAAVCVGRTRPGKRRVHARSTCTQHVQQRELGGEGEHDGP
jgi:hypothetical protein